MDVVLIYYIRSGLNLIFNSFEFIFVFLPIVLLLFYGIGRFNIPIAKAWLLLASLFFYAYWNPSYLPLVLISMVINYLIGSFLSKSNKAKMRKAALIIGIIFNVGLLSYYKYFDFFIQNVNGFFETNLPLQQILLPLAISFYTFTQIAYLVDSYRMETKEYNFLNYGLFVTFFPHLIAGPIVHHKQLAPQFNEKESYYVNYSNFSKGLMIFAIGLFKKVAIADTFAKWANEGYASVETLSFIDSWVTTLSYTLQLYYDFSGYSDMAVGLALLFNIVMPINFNSPYKALDIQDFWRRWHITLSSFLTTYFYIPLGGNRKGKVRTYVNIFIIFLVSGIWHGAGWTFIVWGTLHGIASIICRFWKVAGYKMNKWLAWFITFMFVHFAWVFFRAVSIDEAFIMFQKMFMIDFDIPTTMSMLKTLLLILFGLCLAWFAKNSMEIVDQHKRSAGMAVFIALLLFYSVMQLQQVSEFLYFNF